MRFLSLFLLWPALVFAYLTDTGNHPPATTGTYDYNATPNVGATLTLMQSYVDPVFDTEIFRLTVTTVPNQDDNYAFHYCSKNGTYCMHRTAATGLNIIATSDGSTVRSGTPDGTLNAYEARWDNCVDDQYNYADGNILKAYNVTSGTSSNIKDFGSALAEMGGTGNYQTTDCDLFIVKYGGTVKVWERSTDTIYTNTVTQLNWVGITPSGNNVYTANGGPGGDFPQIDHLAYPVNKTTKTINTSGVKLTYGGTGDHGGLLTGSDGKDYMCNRQNDQNPVGYWCWDLSVDMTGLTFNQQLALGIQFTQEGSVNMDQHASCCTQGDNKDWCFFDGEYHADEFNDAVGAWAAYRQEILAVNPVTGTFRRYAHHRSRAPYNGSAEYFRQPRVSTSAACDVVIWASDMNDSSPTGYADLYLIYPFGADPPAAPTYMPVRQ